VNVEVGIEERLEEPEALQVVEMEMAEQNMELWAHGSLHRDAEWTNSSARIEHEDVSARESHFNAGRIATVPDRIRTGRGDRAAASPHASLHQASLASSATCQNTDTTPCISASVPNNGYAVACTSRCTPSNPVAATVL
jgi:hypothetical protein